MKITATPNTNKIQIPFPKVMVSCDGRIVLFHRSGCGITLQSKYSREVGSYCDEVMMEYFTDYHGTVTIEQE